MVKGEIRRPEAQPKEFSRWFDILFFPSTPNGFQLHLVNNEPRNIKPRHRRKYGRLVEQTLRQKEGTPGFHNPTKMNIHPRPIDPTNPNIISYDATPTRYVDFYALSDKKHLPRKLQEQIRLSGVQVVWRTTEADGSHKIVFEVRSEHSGLYPSFAGTIGGGIDGKLVSSGGLDDRAKLQDASPQRIIDQAVTEAEEELGIGKAVGDRLRQSYEDGDGNLVVMGIAEDRKRHYFDVLCRGILPFDQTTLQSLYDQHKAAGNDKVHDPMPKKLIFMDETPDMYQRLLSFHVALTPMTQAPLLLSGYLNRMELALATENEQTALQKAQAWRDQTARLMGKKDRDMDQIAKAERKRLTREEWRKVWKKLGPVLIGNHKVNKFYEFQEAGRNAWNGARRRPKGLSTRHTPQAQGLPSTETALKQLLED